jgi:hypothetical protein
MSKSAIVILYDGNEPNQLVMTRLMEVLSQSGHRDNQKEANIFYLNERELLQSTVAHVVTKETKSVDDLTEQERAVIVIGEECGPVTIDDDEFTSKLANKYMHALIMQDNPRIVEAVRVLVQPKALSYVREKFRKEYFLYAGRIKAINSVYKAACLGHIGE